VCWQLHVANESGDEFSTKENAIEQHQRVMPTDAAAGAPGSAFNAKSDGRLCASGGCQIEVFEL
jgi:hypothetical protein